MAKRKRPSPERIAGVLAPVAAAARELRALEEQTAQVRSRRDDAIRAALAEPDDQRPTYAQIAEAAGLSRNAITHMLPR
ncbi:MAG: hypothetical protein QM679_10070 [Patulibacter sp.]